MAFALCTSDGLVEVDVQGRIVEMFGATSLLFGKRADQLAGLALESVAAEEDRHLLRALLKHAADGHRFRSAPVQFHHESGSKQTLVLSGYGVPNIGNHCYLTMRTTQMAPNVVERVDRFETSALRNIDGFSDSIRNHFEAAAGPHQGGLTLLTLNGLEAVKNRVLPAVWAQLIRQIGAFLNAVSLEGNAAGHLGIERFGLIHDRTAFIDGICEQIIEFTRTADPENQGCEVIAEPVLVHEIALAGPDLVRAILYTIRQFSGKERRRRLRAVGRDDVSSQLQAAASTTQFVVSTITGSEFDIAYQPIVSLVDNSVHHFEALLRLNNSSPLLSPFDFIVFAEDIGLITEFDLAMSRKAVAKIASHTGGGALKPVAVNISGRSINSPQFLDAINALIERHPTVQNRLMFEITESTRIEDLVHANNVIQDFRKRGFQVCLDDFGSGEAAFDYLHELEVDFVKIDGRYVTDAASNPRDKAFLIAISGLCHDLGITAIAEGIENEAILDFLRGCGITYGQGYMFERPDIGADLTGA